MPRDHTLWCAQKGARRLHFLTQWARRRLLGTEPQPDLFRCDVCGAPLGQATTDIAGRTRISLYGNCDCDYDWSERVGTRAVAAGALPVQPGQSACEVRIAAHG